MVTSVMPAEEKLAIKTDALRSTHVRPNAIEAWFGFKVDSYHSPKDSIVECMPLRGTYYSFSVRELVGMKF